MKIIKHAAAVLTLVTVIMAVVSCGTPNVKTPLALSIVAGQHANSKAINPTATEIIQKVSDATASYGIVSIVCADGNPQLTASWKISPPETLGLAESKLRQISINQAKAILTSLMTVKANSPEVDTIKALNIAVRSFADAPVNSDRQILVLDSGLPTSGELNFLESDLINASPSAVVDLLYSKQAIPDFSNTTVTWIGMADVGAPQNDLSPSQRENLKNIWTAIVEKTGGKAVILDTLPSNDDNPASDFPKVSTIDFLSSQASSVGAVDAIVFRNIQFLGDTTEYADPNSATEILKTVADYLKVTPDFSVLVVGTTAGEDSEDYCMRLSSGRANAVRDTLISLGAAANQIIAVGLGYNDPWHIPDTRPDGALIESVAAENRKIVLMDAAAAEAQSILNAYG